MATDKIEQLRREVKYWLGEYQITGNELCKLNAEAAQRAIVKLQSDEKQLTPPDRV